MRRTCWKSTWLYVLLWWRTSDTSKLVASGHVISVPPGRGATQILCSGAPNNLLDNPRLHVILNGQQRFIVLYPTWVQLDILHSRQEAVVMGWDDGKPQALYQVSTLMPVLQCTVWRYVTGKRAYTKLYLGNLYRLDWWTDGLYFTPLMNGSPINDAIKIPNIAPMVTITGNPCCSC